MKTPKVNRKIIYAKKNLCDWCRDPIKKESYILVGGSFYCSVKCQKQHEKWNKQNDKGVKTIKNLYYP